MKIRHCPFCGSNEIRIGKVEIHGNGNKRPCIECENCGAMITAPKKYPQDALKRWNTRVLDADEQEIYKLQELLRHDAYCRMKDYVGEYDRINPGSVCSNNEFKTRYLEPMQQALAWLKKINNLLCATIDEEEKEDG